MSRSRILGTLACACIVAISTMAVPAGAVPAPPTPPVPTTPVPVINSWAVAPSGPDPGQPGSRPNLSYDLAPGAKITDSVTIFNYGNTQLTFGIYSTDAFNDPSGGFDLLAGDKTPIDVGSWVTLPQSHITVKPLTSVQMPFTLTVPPDARPGDHAAAILASSIVNGQDTLGKVVLLDRRAGTRIYVRVAGPLQPVLTVEKIQTTYHASSNPFDGSLDVRYTVTNAGNVRLGAHQLVELKTPFGRRMKQAVGKDIVELLPGNSLTFSVHFKQVTAAVRLTAQIVVTPFPAGEPKGSTTATSRSGHAWAIPWTLLALVVILSVGWQFWKRYRFRRRLATSPPPAMTYEPAES
jgi:hypothetical protein